MDSPSGPSTKPFSFVLIPAADSQTTQLQRYEGNSDSELRNLLRAYFARVGGSMNESQRGELQRQLQAKLESTKKAKEDDAAAGAVVVGGDNQQQNPADTTLDLLSHAVNTTDDGSFEIIPVVLPTPRSKFIAVSLYIDSTGMIKDLPLNCRASRIAGREIRGDAFLLSNHDDPALDSWERVDTTLADFERLHSNPPQAVNVDGATGAMATMAREDFSRAVSSEDAAAAMQALNDGRAAFAQQQFQQALDKFHECISLLSARTDLLPNDAELQASKTIAMSNGAQCALKLGKWAEAESLAHAAVMRDGTNEKAAFRLCTAKVRLNDFEGAQQLLTLAKRMLSSNNNNGQELTPQQEQARQAWMELDNECIRAQAQFKSAERKQYAKMFE